MRPAAGRVAMTPFDAPDPAHVLALVREQPLALIVSAGTDGAHVTPLPLLPLLDAAGAISGFEGHFAKRNPQVETLRRDPAALILFQGPHRYLPAASVSDPAWIPTWNYAIAQFEAVVEFRPERTRDAVDRLTERLEPGGWRAATHVPHRQAGMLAQVVAFEARVRRSAAKFKLGQDERPAAWAEIVDGLGADPLARWMQAVRSG